MLARRIVRISVVAVAVAAMSAWFRMVKSSASYVAILCRIRSSSVICCWPRRECCSALVAETRIWRRYGKCERRRRTVV